MDAPSQRFLEVTNQNKTYQIDAFEKLDLTFNPNLLNNNSLNGSFALTGTTGALKKSASKTNGNQSKLELPKVNVQTFSEHPICLSDYKLTPNFVKYIEQNNEELDDLVEYDMDEEDNLWLKIINEERQVEDPNSAPVTREQFETLMDRLEKESYFQQSSTASNLNKSNNDSSSEDALCCICLDGECLNSNAILFCDLCNLAVHQECYGVPYIPEGQWLCRRCIQSPSTPVNCILCPNRYGAFKQTDDGLWAHVVCAIWIPEVHFANTVFLEPIIGIENIDKARWKLTCYICRKRNAGACIQCDKSNCYTAFHVTCAQQAGLYMNIREEVVEPEIPAGRKKKGHNTSQKQAANSSSSSVSEVRKCAYCDIHTPLDVLSPKTRRNICNGNSSSVANSDCEEALKAAKKMRMKKARKILAERRNAAPVVSMPVLPKEKIQDIKDRVYISNMESFFSRLMSYWLMKRFSRNGVPLLRRLQHTPGLKKNLDRSENNEKENSGDGSNDEVDKKEEDDAKFRQQLNDHFSYCVKLRQDLERARLLMELVRKREKTKRELLRIDEIITMYEINPLNGVFLQRLLEVLRSYDKSRVFFYPVDPAIAPGYYDIIKQPMDFSKMQEKIKRQAYRSFSHFEHDFHLIINNCLKYNPKNTSYYKIAFKLREQTSSLLKQAKRTYDNLNLESEFPPDSELDYQQQQHNSDTSINATADETTLAAINETTINNATSNNLDNVSIANENPSSIENNNQTNVDMSETIEENDEANALSTTSSRSTRRRNSTVAAAKITSKKRVSSMSSSASSSLITNLAINESNPSTAHSSNVPSPNPSSSTTNTTTTTN